jgi:hypothetical protein
LHGSIQRDVYRKQRHKGNKQRWEFHHWFLYLPLGTSGNKGIISSLKGKRPAVQDWMSNFKDEARLEAHRTESKSLTGSTMYSFS